MTDNRKFDDSGEYQIRVSGILDERWSDWFDGFVFEQSSDDETSLIGKVTDQAALHGLLNKIRDIGLPLISVERIE
jgi:hypothetical protein